MSSAGTDHQTAVDNITRDGLYVLKDVVSQADLSKFELYGLELALGAMLGIGGAQVSEGKARHEGWLRSNDILKDLPIPEILYLPHVNEIMSRIFRESGVSGNSAASRDGATYKILNVAIHCLAPGASKKPLHRDINHLFGGRFPTLPPAMMAVHVPIGRFTEENGAIRVIPGTHHSLADVPSLGDEDPDWIGKHTVSMAPGDVLIRDPRAWHGAGRNSTKDPRIMFSMIYGAEWYSCERSGVSRHVLDRLPHVVRRTLRALD